MADFHLDATSSEFVQHFLKQRPDWVVTSPPYDSASSIAIVKNAHAVARRGVCVKVLLSFLEPCESRRDWLLSHPPSMCIILPRMTYGNSARLNYTECWLVWDKLASYAQQLVWSIAK